MGSTSIASSLTIGVLATGIACAGAAAGVYATGHGRLERWVVPLSGGILVGVAAVGLAPEIAREIGWWLCLGLFAAGYGVLYGLDRLGYPICPSCSHGHDHSECATRLHGFTTPIVTATALHAFLDGWGATSAAWSGSSGLRLAVPVAILLHKVPEGLALGSILKASNESARKALGWAVFAELFTLAGTGVALGMGAGAGQWVGAFMNYALAVAGGFFLYLGVHAVHGDWRRHGAGSAVLAAAGGIAAVAMQWGARMIWAF